MMKFLEVYKDSMEKAKLGLMIIGAAGLILAIVNDTKAEA